MVSDVIEGRRTPEAMLQIAEPIDGPYVARFRRLAKRLGTSLCFGFAELVGSEVYNAAVFIDRDGQIRGKYHKTQFAEGTTKAWPFNRIGKNLRAFDTPLGRVGIVICAGPVEPDDSPYPGARRRQTDTHTVLRLEESGPEPHGPGPRSGERRADSRSERWHEPDRQQG